MSSTFALPNIYEMLTILAMASATYSTRIIGFLWLRKRTLSARARAVLDSSPCCVMVSVAAQSFMTTDIKMLAALFFAFALSFKFNLGITICASVVLLGILQNFL